MARCEAAVRTTLAFHRDTNPRRDFFAAADLAPLAIRFEHRDFVWHPNREAGPDGEDWWPGVTVVADDPRSFDPEKEAMHRFLSALAFHLHEPIEVLNLGGSGVSNPFDRPITRAARGGLGDRHELAPTEVAVVGDDRLRLVLALYREGLNSESPFYRFLSFWNALDAAHNADDSAVDAFIDAQSPRLATLATPHRTKRSSWSSYLRESSRNAIAHAVRSQPHRPVIDPDLPADRYRLYLDSRLLDELIREAVESRWPSAVTAVRRA